MDQPFEAFYHHDPENSLVAILDAWTQDGVKSGLSLIGAFRDRVRVEPLHAGFVCVIVRPGLAKCAEEARS